MDPLVVDEVCALVEGLAAFSALIALLFRVGFLMAAQVLTVSFLVFVKG